jgi:hypothetical protein
VDAEGQQWPASIVKVDSAEDVAILTSSYQAAGASINERLPAHGEPLTAQCDPRANATRAGVIAGQYQGLWMTSGYASKGVIFPPRLLTLGGIVVQPGCSGGPVYDATGTVIGVIQSTDLKATSYAVPIGDIIALTTS